MVWRRLVTAVIFSVALAFPATLIRYPYLQNLVGNRGTVVWTTKEAGAGSVQYSTDRSFSQAATASLREFLPAETDLPTRLFQYHAELKGLRPGTEYFYRVLVDGQEVASGDDLRFRTPGPGPFTFLAFGDSGLGSPEQARLAQLILRESPSLVLHTGDLAYPVGSYETYDREYFAYYRDLMKRVPFFPSPGNHDYYQRAAAYVAVHAPPTDGVPAEGRGRYYSFDWGNAHFVALDSNASLSEAVSGTGKMFEWLENDLAKTRQFWRIAYFHHPPYATGIHEADARLAVVRQYLVPILERHRVHLVLNGDEHSYQRSFPLYGGVPVEPGLGTVYVVTGGGGAALYTVSPRPFLAYQESAHHYLRCDVDGGRLVLRAIRIDGQEIDRYTLKPPPSLDPGTPVNAASYTPSLAPGSLISIFGRELGVEKVQAAGFPLPTDLAGASVSLNGNRLPLLYVSSPQINAQLPYDVSGSVTLEVSAPNGSPLVLAGVRISDVAPAVFRIETGSGPAFAITHLDGAIVSSAYPAKPGEWLTVYLTGLGAVNGEIVAGHPAPLRPLMSVSCPVEARIGGRSVTPGFAGLTPGYAGLYQVNLQVLGDLATGTHPVQIVACGIASETMGLPVQ